MSGSSPLVGRSGFAQAVAETTPILAELAQEAIDSHKRREPHWARFGKKAIEIVEKWEVALWEQEAQKAPETPRTKLNGGSNDPDWSRKIVAKKHGRGAVEKPSPKKKGREIGGRKWAGVKHGGGFGSPLKKGWQMPAEDEDDEEALPVARVKEEVDVKMEDDEDSREQSRTP